MAGPDPAIHVVMQENYFKSMYLRKNVDARLKAGHDDVSLLRLFGVLGGLALRKSFNAEVISAMQSAACRSSVRRIL
jgi:hypothetical protein